MLQSIRAAKAVKSLVRNIITSFTAGYQPPSILSYVVAYDAPASMNTVQDWFAAIHAEYLLGYKKPYSARVRVHGL